MVEEMKDILQIQRDHIRVLAYEKNADMGEFNEMTFNIVVGSEDMTISWADFERLLELMTAANCLLPQECE
jgi:hypothetical protein